MKYFIRCAGFSSFCVSVSPRYKFPPSFLFCIAKLASLYISFCARAFPDYSMSNSGSKQYKCMISIRALSRLTYNVKYVVKSYVGLSA